LLRTSDSGNFVLDTPRGERLSDQYTLTRLFRLVAFMNLCILVVPRCCAPCCCGAEMPDVPRPCLFGRCTCANGKLQDCLLILAHLALIFHSSLWKPDPFGISWAVTVLLCVAGTVAGVMKYVAMMKSMTGQDTRRPPEAVGPLAVVVGQPVRGAVGPSVRGSGSRAPEGREAQKQGDVQEEPKPEARACASSDAAGSDTPGSAKVSGARARGEAPEGFGSVELVDASRQDDCEEVIRALYCHVENGDSRSQQVQIFSKHTVFVPEADIVDLVEVNTCPKMIELRRQMEQRSKRRAPRLKFFFSDGSSVKCEAGSAKLAERQTGKQQPLCVGKDGPEAGGASDGA